MWYITDPSDRYCIHNVENLWEHTLCHLIYNFCVSPSSKLLPPKTCFLQIQSSEKKKKSCDCSKHSIIFLPLP